jgi:hypothetical protein
LPRKKVLLPPKVKCPDCDAEYPTAKGLSSHRRSVHNYVSENNWAVSVRKKKQVEAAPALAAIATMRTPLTCDKCDFQANNVSALTWHKARNHSTPHELACDLCDFKAKWPGGLTLHKRKAHADANPTPEKLTKFDAKSRRPIVHSEKTQTLVVSAPATSNGHHPGEEAHTPPDGIPEATLALGLGRFQELSRSIAFEHDLPPRMFAARLAGLIYAATVR